MPYLKYTTTKGKQVLNVDKLIKFDSSSDAPTTIEVWDTQNGQSVRFVKRLPHGEFLNNKSARQLTTR